MMRTKKRKERFQSIYQAMEPFRVAKKNTIHTIAGVGRKHKILRYPLLICLVAFIFIYNLFLYLFMGLKMDEKLTRAMAFLMTGILVFTSIDLTTFAMMRKDEEAYYVVGLSETDSYISVAFGTVLEELELPEFITATLERYTYEEPTEEVAEEITEEITTEAVTEEAASKENVSEEVTTEDITSAEETTTEETTAEETAEEETTAEEPTEETTAEESSAAEEVTAEETAEEVSTEEITTEAVTEEVTSEEVTVEETTADTTAETPSDATSEESVVVEEQVTEETIVPETTEDENMTVEKVAETITVDLPVTWSCENYDGKVPGQYVFTATLPEKVNGCRLIYDDVVLPSLIVEVMEAKSLTMSAVVDGIEITMVSMAGVFPEDAQLSVTKIEDEESIAKIEEAIQNSLDKSVEDEEDMMASLKKTITFDIVVLDKDGLEIQPVIPEGVSSQQAVTVTFKQVVGRLETELTEGEKEAEAQQTMEVFYVDDSMDSAVMIDSQVDSTDMSFSPEHFSLYSCSCYVYTAKGIYSWKDLYKAVYGKTGEINVRLRDDIDISKLTFYSNSNRLLIKNGQTVNIDLNGHYLYNSVSGQPAIEVRDGVLNIHDRTYGTGKIASRNGSYVIYASSSDATVNLLGGYIVRGGSESYGIYATRNATVNIKGGCIYGSFPYGVYFNSSYRETGSMSSGAIDGANYGVYIGGSTYRGSSFTMTGGTIKNCKSAGIYNNSGKVYMTGGEISGNSSYKAYGIINTGSSQYLELGGAVKFGNNRAADIYVGNNSSNLININSQLTGTNIGVATQTTPTITAPVRFTVNANANSMKKFYSAQNSSYAVWQPVNENAESQNYFVVGPKENCNIVVQPVNVKVNPASEEIAGTVSIGTGAASKTQISTKVKYNASVTLKATLINSEEYEFTGWKDKTGNIVSPSLVYTFTATDDNIYTAVFTKKKVTVNVGTSSSTRGSATITNYSLGAVPADRKFEVGSTITIKATANSTSSTTFQFAQWNDGDTNSVRTVVVTGDATYTAQFKKPDPDPNKVGTLYAGVKEIFSYPANGTKIIMIAESEGGMESTDDGYTAVTTLPDDFAIAVFNTGEYSSSYTYPDCNIRWSKKGAAFDGCNPGGIHRVNNKWYYWCCNGGNVQVGPYRVYSYTDSQTFKAGDIKAELNSLKLSPDKKTVEIIDITLTIGRFTIISKVFEDKEIDYTKGDRRIELNVNDVLFTYTLPEDGELVKVEKTASSEPSDSPEGITVGADGSVDANAGDTLTIGNGTYTSKDSEGSFDMAFNSETGEIVVETGETVEVTNGNVTFKDNENGDVAVSTTGDKPVLVQKTENDEKPVVTIPSGGNAAIDDGADGSAVEIKVPSGSSEKQVTTDSDGNISVEMEDGEKVTIGGIVYTADKDGEIKVNGETGGLVDNTSVEPSEEHDVTEIDPESFDKENYLLEVQPGESVKVGNTTYTAPVSGMKLQGNPDGNPVIVINREGEAVKVGDKSYTAGSDGTKIVVNGPNNITLVDNGSETDNSALVVDSIGTMIIDGNTITCSGTENAGYTITKTTGGADSIDVADGTRVSVKIPSGGSSLFVPEQMQYNGKTTSSSGALIKAPSSGTINIALDKTTQDENENYVLTSNEQ